MRSLSPARVLTPRRECIAWTLESRPTGCNPLLDSTPLKVVWISLGLVFQSRFEAICLPKSEANPRLVRGDVRARIPKN